MIKFNPDTPLGWEDDDKWTKMLREIDEMDKDPEERQPRVTLPVKKRNGFNKVGYNPNHLPHQGNYNKVRAKKPRLQQWDQPTYDWPPVLPRPTQHKHKRLVLETEREQKLDIQGQREWQIPNFRSGDVLKLKVYSSQTEKKVSEYSGVCIGKKARNSINATCSI